MTSSLLNTFLQIVTCLIAAEMLQATPIPQQRFYHPNNARVFVHQAQVQLVVESNLINYGGSNDVARMQPEQKCDDAESKRQNGEQILVHHSHGRQDKQSEEQEANVGEAALFDRNWEDETRTVPNRPLTAEELDSLLTDDKV